MRIDLRPYPGHVVLCKTRKELHKRYRKITGKKYPYEDEPEGGRYIVMEGSMKSDTFYLVWAGNTHALAHEFAHVVLHLFNNVGIDPRESSGEPFCYMLSQLMLEAK